jgi:hypothetical protein
MAPLLMPFQKREIVIPVFKAEYKLDNVSRVDGLSIRRIVQKHRSARLKYYSWLLDTRCESLTVSS